MRTNPSAGFSLIELLVVVLILGTLAAIAIPVFVGQQIGAQDTAARSDLQNARIAMNAYLSSHGNDTLPDATDLRDLGFVASAGVSTPTIRSGTHPGEFCIDTRSAADHWFMVSEARGVESGAC